MVASAGRLLDRLFDAMGRVIGWLLILMVITAFVVVVLRYVFNVGWIGLQEAITYLHATSFMLALAWVLREDGHVRVDVFYRQFSDRHRRLVDRAGLALLVLPVAGFMLWQTWPYALTSWRMLEGSREAGGLPLVWLLKGLMPLAALLLVLQALSLLLRGWPGRGQDTVPPG